jgi:hypothetical protein
MPQVRVLPETSSETSSETSPETSPGTSSENQLQESDQESYLQQRLLKFIQQAVDRIPGFSQPTGSTAATDPAMATTGLAVRGDRLLSQKIHPQNRI